jgi:hypothetical protein
LVWIVALYHGGLEALGTRHFLTDADDLGVLREIGPPWGQPLQGVPGDGGQLLAVGNQKRCADGRAGQHRGRDPRLPVVHVDERNRGGAIGGSGRGEEGRGDSGSVRGRVAAADAHRVAGGAGGRTDPFRRLVVVRLNAELRRACLLIAEAAAAEQAGRHQHCHSATHRAAG